MSAYRVGQPPELACPRCKKKLPPLDVATCACGCVWISAFAATELMTSRELKADPVTRWWRVREPCPECGEKMMLRGDEPGLFQGCDLHGYFIDADTVEHTSLAKGIDHAALDRKRQDTRRVEEEREQREVEASRRARERAAADEREHKLEQELAERAEASRRVGMTEAEADRRAPAPAPRDPDELLLEKLALALGVSTARELMDRIRRLERRVRDLESGQ